MTRAENCLYRLLSSAQNYCFCLGQESLKGWRVDELFGMMFMVHVVFLSRSTIPRVDQIAYFHDLLPFIQLGIKKKKKKEGGIRQNSGNRPILLIKA